MSNATYVCQREMIVSGVTFSYLWGSFNIKEILQGGDRYSEGSINASLEDREFLWQWLQAPSDLIGRLPYGLLRGK